MREIKRIVIHTSDSADDADIGAAEIKHLHTAPKSEKINWYGYDTTGRAWSDIGYHWVVRKNGEVEQGRPESRAGAHVAGHNSDSLGIVWVGRSAPTEAQRKALIKLIEDKCKEYNLDKKDVYGHKELDSKKTCPNLDMDKLRADLFFCCKKACKNHKVSTETQEHLPDGPTETDIEVTLEDIENEVFRD